MYSQCLADVYWISGWYILVMKQLTELTVEVNCRLSPYNKENNYLESSYYYLEMGHEIWLFCWSLVFHLF